MRPGLTPCWPWTLYCEPEWGYGVAGWQGGLQKAHRLAFFLTEGHWPEPQCNHHCDNPPCCNPEHLYEGTQTQNNEDMVSRGRHVPPPFGELNWRSGISDTDRAELVRRYKELPVSGTRKKRGSVQVLLDEFGVSITVLQYSLGSRKTYATHTIEKEVS
jgi:hypothetical protein